MQTDLFRQGSIKYYQERDHKRLLAVPLFAADTPLGYLGLSFLDSTPVDEQRSELVATFAHQAALAIQLTRLADEAEKAAALDERNRIAREIHDVLAQGFTGVIFQLETAKRVFGETTPAKVSEYVSRSIELAREGLAQARSSVQALRPPAEDLQLDLPRLLREKLSVLTIGTNIETEFSTIGKPVQFPPETMLNLLRIGQEAIVNALRHSESSRITVDLDYNEGVSLRVTDNGIGFETAEMGQSEGYGLRGMRERAAAIKAKLNIQSESGSGTSVTVSLNRKINAA
jgi:signal transduction histidine kinase